MIYIHESTYKYFKNLTKFVQFHLDEESELTNDYTKKGLWIVTYATYLDWWAYADHRVENYIAIQTEPLHVKGHEGYMSFLNGAKEVWDYTKNFRVGYSPFWELEVEEAKDIDILFYGTMNRRRDEILKTIPNVTVKDKVWGVELDSLIRRSKIVLSIHHHNVSNADMTRVAPLLSKRAFVIGETTSDKRYNALSNIFPIADRDKIPKLCEYYLKKPLERIEIINNAYNWIKNEYSTSFPSIYG